MAPLLANVWSWLDERLTAGSPSSAPWPELAPVGTAYGPGRGSVQGVIGLD